MKILIELDVSDAILAGCSMLTLAKSGRLHEPVMTAIYERVGQALADAAQNAAKTIAKQATEVLRRNAIALGRPVGTPPHGVRTLIPVIR